MGFREEVAADNAAVFVNCEEFAEIHNLNGVQAAAVVQKIAVNSDISCGDAEVDKIYSLYGETVVVNFQSQFLREKLSYGDPYTLDGEQYIVKSCSDDMGIVTLELIGNER